MSIIGKTLGNFECTALLGKGGMGEVYRAKDQRLGRDVAIKVLPEEFAKDADRVARFQREAKLLASLNHPNIAAIHGLEESDGMHFLVLELIEGDTLADRLKHGAIPPEESLNLALQIAEALEAAHEKGVIHRDLKPANIKVTPDGKVKVLDFGLAKAFAGDQEDMNLSNSPTLSVAATKQGMILGTAAYMSPEQAKGRSVDKRADIWAFGAVLFEMLTGRPAFQEEDVTEILASVVKASIDLDLLPADINPQLRGVIARCLRKDLKKRYRDIGDVQYEIEQILDDPRGVLVRPTPAVKPQKEFRRGIAWVAAAVILTAVIAGIIGWNLRTAAPRQVGRFYCELTQDQQFGNLQERCFAVSPDGSQIVYKTERGLFLRSMAEWDAKLIAGTEENPQKPFFSPDGQWIGYISGSQGNLRKISINGGTPVSLADISSSGRLDWGSDDSIVYCAASSIMEISANGGEPEVLVEQTGTDCYAPQILPDGKNVMYTVGPSPYKIMLHSLETGESKELFVGDTAYYLPTGHIVYVVENSICARRFNLDRLEVTGGEISMLGGVLRSGGAPQYAVSDSGTLVYIPGEGIMSASDLTLVWVDRDGKEETIDAPANQYGNFRISPDGTRAALSVALGTNMDIWIWDFVRETLDPLTRNEGEDACPVWSADGKTIAFHTHQKDARGSVYLKAADGTGEEVAAGTFPGQEIFPWCWSSDGTSLAVRTGYVGTVLDIGVLSMEGDHPYRPLLQERYAEVHPKISPDGQWLAYTSDESGENQIYVRSFPDVKEQRIRISQSGGEDPLWSPDGLELYYRNGDEVLAVSVETDPTFRAGIPKVIFRGTYYSSWPNTSWDIHPDGKRFLMLKPYGTSDEEPARRLPQRINVVLNWIEELKERVPVE